MNLIDNDMDVIDKQIISNALKQYIDYLQQRVYTGMDKREVDDFIVRIENLNKQVWGII
jgi:hypothetical protein